MPAFSLVQAAHRPLYSLHSEHARAAQPNRYGDSVKISLRAARGCGDLGGVCPFVPCISLCPPSWLLPRSGRTVGWSDPDEDLRGDWLWLVTLEIAISEESESLEVRQSVVHVATACGCTCRQLFFAALIF